MPASHWPRQAVRQQLTADHERLEALFERLLAAFDDDDREACAELWTTFESDLCAHMSDEERYLIPELLRQDPPKARAILEEHKLIRHRLAELGTAVDLHCLRRDTARAFIDELRAHARTEDRTLYAWADQHVPACDRESLFESFAERARARVAGRRSDERHAI